MLTLIQRVQYPVGQGGFHSCNIHTDDDTNPGSASVFDYVYDCGTYSLAPDGASRLQHITRHINRYQPVDGEVDLLFLSHLDADHYNGAEQLCASKKVARIVLPYFTVEEVCFVVAQQSLKDRAAPVSLGYVKALFSLANGGSTLFGVPVTRVMPGTNDPIDPDPNRPDGPAPLPPIEPDGDTTSRAVACTLDSRGQLMPLGDGIANGSSIVLAAPATSAAGTSKAQVLPVILRPWSYKQSPAAVAHMRRTIAGCKPLENLLQKNGNVTASDIAALEKAKTKVRVACRQIIKDAGGIYAGSKRHPNVNSPSLCLYSGINPAPNPPFATKTRCWREHSNWIATGDALLKRHWNEFEACFKDVLRLTGTYVVPHHGSIHNHRSEFIHAVRPDATAIISSGFGETHHPARSVLADIHRSGHALAHVTEFDQHGSQQYSTIWWK